MSDTNLVTGLPVAPRSTRTPAVSVSAAPGARLDLFNRPQPAALIRFHFEAFDFAGPPDMLEGAVWH